MAILKQRWFLDVIEQRLVRDLASNLEATLPPLTQGDIIDAEIHTVEPTGNGSFRYVDADALTCKAGLFALTDDAPTEGEILWGYDGDWTAAVSAAAAAATVQTPFNALASVTAAGGVTVTKVSDGTYEFTFDEPGARELILADVEAVYPSAYAKTRRKIVGDVDTREVQRVSIRPNPAAGQTVWTALPASEASVESLSIGSHQVQRITFDPVPVDGQLLLGYGAASAVMPVSGDATDLRAALEAIPAVGTGKVTVTGDFASGFVVVFGGLTAGSVLALLPDSSGLIGPKGKKAQIEIEGPEVDDLLAGAEETKVLLEIEMREDGRPHTLLQLETELRNGRIEPESDTRPPLDRILGESEAEARFFQMVWVTKTANHTAVVRERLLCDTSGGAFVVTLPPDPEQGNQVEIGDPAESWADDNLTVARNGHLIEGVAEDLVANVAGGHFLLVFVGGAIGWRIFDL